MDTRVWDHATGYGLVSRFFHWSMAALMLWQAISSLLHYLFDETAVSEFFFALHKPLGVVLLALTLIRGLWGLSNVSRRPQHVNMIDRLATVGHVTIYLLLFIVPSIALIRQYGSGKEFSVFGIQLFPGFEPKIEWMTNLGGALHGEIGWVLLVLIGGHITMAFAHDILWNERKISRMTYGSE